MKQCKQFLWGMLILGLACSASAQAPEPEEVSIRFTFCLLPINESTANSGTMGEYVRPSLSYRNGNEPVDLTLSHGQSIKDLRYRGPPILNFFNKEGGEGEPPQRAGSVQLNPEWTEVLLLAISDPQRVGYFHITAVDATDLTLNPGDLYVYNLTEEEMFVAVGEVKHRLPPGRLKPFNCDFSSRRLQTVVMATRREERFQSVFNNNMGFSRERSNLLLIYFEEEDPQRPRVKLVRGISL